MQLHRFWRRYTKGVLALLLCGATFTSAHAIEFMKVEDLHRGMVGHADFIANKSGCQWDEELERG